MQPPSVPSVTNSSITLQWNEPPPAIPGNPPRYVSQYAVTYSPHDGGNSHVVLVPAETGAEYNITGLLPETLYDIGVDAVINTNGQGEHTYDLGVRLLTVSTGKNVIRDASN